MTTSDLLNSDSNLLNRESIVSNPDQSCQVLPESTQACAEVVKPTQTYSFEGLKHQLTAEHQAHILGRGLMPGWGAESCITSDIPRATLMLGYEAKSAGIMLMSAEYGLWQFRPDNPWPSKNGTEPKYRTPKADYDIFLPPHPTNRDYWKDLDALKKLCFTIADEPYLIITEGGFKAIMGCQHDLPTVAGAGVTMFLTPISKGHPELVPGLARLAEAGFNFIIAFDSDEKPETIKNVQAAERRLKDELEGFGCIVISVTGKWPHSSPTETREVKSTKGMDDFIQHNGIEKFREILIKAGESAFEPPIASGDEPPKAKKPPSPQNMTARLAEEFGHQLKYDEEQQTWRKWSGKHWEKMGLGAFKSWLKNTLDGKNINYGNIAYIEDVRKLLECDLRQLKWQFWDKSRYISFSNCVFDGAEAKTMPHSPGMGFTSYLPYGYKPLEGDLGNSFEALQVNCPKIYQFFHEAMKGDKRKMFKLLAIINALLKHRFFDLQMFVHLVGAPGSGKGKFARFCQKLVGKDNTIACQLDRLSDGSTKASLIDKQLVVFPDERKPVGIDIILSLTGGDEISYRELYQPAASAHFYGSLLICSNKPIFVGDTTGLERRLCLVGFDNPIATDKRDHSLESELDSEIPACIAIALSLSDSAVTQAIQGKGSNQIVEFRAKEWEMKCETDSIAAFFDSGLVLDSAATTTVGKLFEAYKNFCSDGGMSHIKIVKFPRMLADVLADENLPVTRHQGRIASFEGLRLRADTDTHPTHSEILAGVVAGVCGSLAGVCAGVEPLPDIHQRELRELKPKTSAGIENHDFLPDEQESDREIEDLCPQTPATPANPLAVRDTTPAPTPAQLPQVTPPTPAKVEAPKLPAEPEYKVGDLIQVRADYITPQLCNQQAVVKKDCGNNNYQIDFGRMMETPFVAPKRFFYMDSQYFHHVTAGAQLELPL